MTDREDLIRAVKELAIVRGRVTLASGKEADYYVDMRRVTLDGMASPLVGRVMSDLVADLKFEAVGGLTLGADPVATAMLHARAAAGGRLDAFVVRKEAKSGRGGHLDDRRIGPDSGGSCATGRWGCRGRCRGRGPGHWSRGTRCRSRFGIPIRHWPG